MSEQPQLSDKLIKQLLSQPLESEADRRAFARVATAAANRQSEGLLLYRPRQEQTLVHTSIASELCVRGGVRSGKTISVAAEFSSAATGQPICGPDGNALPFKYKRRHALTLWVIGFDQTHIGQTIHRVLFEENLFKIIRDKTTGKWRAFQPWREDDLDREHECRASPPLIPERLIDKNSWGWEDKAKRIFSACRLTNGNKIFAFSSSGEPKKGDPVDLVWIDEDIAYPDHVAEWQSRLSDRKGRLIWSVFPYSKNSALSDMSDRAQAQKDREKPDVQEIVLRFSDNPYIDSDEKRKRLEGWSELERLARDEGEFVTSEFQVYPGFSPFIHGLPSSPGSQKDELEMALERNGWRPPRSWTRYISIDPGHTVGAALFLAVPPPQQYGDFVVVYDEIHQRKSDAYKFAELVLEKVAGDPIESFIIDSHAARQTPIGHAEPVKRQYQKAFEKFGITSNQSGSGFMMGSDNISAGISLVRESMRFRQDGTTRLRVVTKKVPELIREIDRYRKKVTRDETKEEPNQVKCDACDCLRYAISHNLAYVDPTSSEKPLSRAYRAFMDLFGKKDETEATVMGPAA